jgi:hypothetical protein
MGIPGKQEGENRTERLKNAGLLLKPPHIPDDLIHIVGADGVNLGHVAEFPMVSANTIGSRALEGGIPMMIRFIDFVHEGRALTGAHRCRPVAGRAVGFELGLPGLQVSRHL